MRHRRIGELMTREVVSVRGDASFKEVARTLSQHRVTAVPVLNGGGRVVGVVSEGDLLRKTADQAAAPGDRPAVPNLEAWERAKAEGTRAEELMSAPPVCARPDWTVAETARLMEVQGIKRRGGGGGGGGGRAGGWGPALAARGQRPRAGARP
ncbi:CBS domain-containing protein, partial [Streptomyces sp. NPDC059762]|uniref:CBS domain-containing protein n=1 Tax=Streptomyces sp. NPDC059762 TaxID=3346938 RepID=UPI00365A6357